MVELRSGVGEVKQNGTELIFGEQRVAVTRYVGYKVSGNRKGMIINLREPEEEIRIAGQENVTAALLEIDSVLDVDEREWKDVR